MAADLIHYDDLVSIITPAYNAANFIRQTIESVLAQTYPFWELIIVDDGSTDATICMVKEYCTIDKRIAVIQTSKNTGPAAARNLGLSKAKGRYIIFLDSDDLILPQKLELQRHFMMSKGAAISCTAYRFMSDDGNRVGRLVIPPLLVRYDDELHQTIFCGAAVMIDRQLTGNFTYQTARNEDYLLWLMLLKRGHIAYGMPDDLFRYRRIRGSRSSNKITSAFGVWNIYRKHEKLGLIKSAICFCSYAITSTIRNYIARPDNGQGGGIYRVDINSSSSSGR
ncbi:MAG: glycosyltransferase [Pelosinus sp.]|nr:glycosyltransferase [Pelosinus sp.]